MKTFFQFLNENNEILELFHGSNTKLKTILPNKLFFLSTRKYFSDLFGKHLYYVTIKPKKIFDSRYGPNKEKILKDLEESNLDWSLLCSYLVKDGDMTWCWVEMIIQKGNTKDLEESVSSGIGSGLNYFKEQGYDCILITESHTINYIIWSDEIVLNVEDFDLVNFENSYKKNLNDEIFKNL